MKIYTKGGDKGKTGIRGGQRVDKDDIRIEANGCLDELNSGIGIVRSLLPTDHDWHEPLYHIQYQMMMVMSQVATPNAIRDDAITNLSPITFFTPCKVHNAIREDNPNKIDDNIVQFCEEWIDRLTAKMGKSEYFILPGGSAISAHLHLARTIARRSERRLWTLHKSDPLPEIILKFINRLSDLLFTMARYDLFNSGDKEERWKHFLYKRKIGE